MNLNFGVISQQATVPRHACMVDEISNLGNVLPDLELKQRTIGSYPQLAGLSANFQCLSNSIFHSSLYLSLPLYFFNLHNFLFITN